jgi:hypothetical protein
MFQHHQRKHIGYIPERSKHTFSIAKKVADTFEGDVSLSSKIANSVNALLGGDSIFTSGPFFHTSI